MGLGEAAHPPAPEAAVMSRIFFHEIHTSLNPSSNGCFHKVLFAPHPCGELSFVGSLGVPSLIE